MRRSNQLLVAFAFLLVGAQAHAVKYGMAGCGLGSLIFEDKPGKIQILAGTTNGVYGNNTSAMSSGTSNCVDTPARETAMYIIINKSALEKDIARGRGETLAGLMKVMKCSNQDAIAGALQSNYPVIFSTPAVEPVQVEQSIKETIQNHNLASSCQALS